MPGLNQSVRSLRGLRVIVLGLMTLLCIFNYANATVVCDECRPLDLQEVPGVGISLAPGYGSASVQFANGTVTDIISMHGNDAYLKAMKHWQRLDHTQATLALNTTISQKRQRGRLLDREAKIRPSHVEMLGPDSPQMDFKLLYFASADGSLDNLNDNFKPIAEMIAQLFHRANKTTAMKYNRAHLTLPDFVKTTSSNMTRPLRPLLRRAGLESTHARFQTHSQTTLLNLYGLNNCYDIPVDDYTDIKDTECEEYQGRSIQSVLFVGVDSSSLSLRAMIRDDGFFFPDMGSTELFWNDEEAKEDWHYWTLVNRELRKFVEQEDVAFDLLSLSGTQATVPELQRILEDVLGGNRNIRSQDYLRRPDDHIFAAARGAALIARVEMCNDFVSCLPRYPWCPFSESCSECGWRRASEEDIKKEL